jgi:hypothetical protein
VHTDLNDLKIDFDTPTNGNLGANKNQTPGWLLGYKAAV